MRIEAVQNERRPYTTSTIKHDLIGTNLNNQRIRKQNDSTSLNLITSSSNGIYPLTSLLANLTNNRDNTIQITTNENKTQQQSTLHSILTSASRVKSPTSSARRKKRFNFN
jgi:hypothetical protein